MADANEGGAGNSARHDPLVGRRLASYEVLARVARGGMGVVYRARHVYIDKIVALKVLDPALAEREDLIERFRTEAQSLARVEHDNVVKVIDILEDTLPGSEQSVHFIVMDFAEGVNLRNHVKKNGPMNPEELLSVARQSAEALYVAHRQGILHRDIKPENLIMNSRGRCKLADFGLAGDLRLISEGHEGPLNFGTPAYSAPEVMRRMVPDKRSDIFSFGATLYFLATGEPPFGQTGAQAIMMRQKQGAELLDARRPDLPEKLSRLVMDCIAYHPKDRPASFNEVMDRLPRRIHTRRMEPTAGTSTEPTEPMQLDSGTHETPEIGGGRNIAIAAAVLAVVAVVIVLGVIFWPKGSAPLQNNDVGQANTGPGNNANLPANNAPPGNVDDDGGDDGDPAFRPEDEAFNAAELDSRAALSNADYSAAYAAWAGFIRRYPNSEYVGEARERQKGVMQRVEELRDQAYDKAVETCEEALDEKRTAEALAALDRFPAELLEPLSDTDEVAVEQKLDTQRQRVIAVEATDLARLLEDADELRTEWKEDRGNSELSEFRRMRSAGNLLEERQLIEDFLPGRTEDTQEKLGKRLASLRKLLESAHQDAMAPVESWRKFNDEVQGAWAEQVIAAINGFSDELEKRRFEVALDALDELRRTLLDERTRQAGQVTDPQLVKPIGESVFILDQLALYRDDLELAADMTATVESLLRLARRANIVRAYLVHAEIDADGNRSARIDKFTGRVVSVSVNEFVVEDDGERHTLKIDMLTADTVRRVVHASDELDDQLSLVAWLTALARHDDAETEYDRLARIDDVPQDILDRAAAITRSDRLAPDVIRRLRYMAVRSGVLTESDPDGEFGEGSLEARLAGAQAGVAIGDVQAADRYIAAVREVADPELVHLETFEKALEIGQPLVGDLRAWVLLEPLNPDAHAALAEKLAESGEEAEAKTTAGKALLLDPSNETAWRIRNR